MIDKREIIDTADTLSLNPHMIEKDYVLGWLLWGICNHEASAESWIFKGGTCLKKCFLETYRFSEDLDFTLTDTAHIDVDFLAKVFDEIGARVYKKSGIELPSVFRRFEIYENSRGRKSVQGRIGYLGPVSPRGKSTPRIKIDLTADEYVVMPPVRSPVSHPYSDKPEGGIVANSYAYTEVFAEKIRALGERASPRDLYDVISLFRNEVARPVIAILLDILHQKCEFKGIDVPILAELGQRRAGFEGSWSPMLAHQLPVLPPVGAYWNELTAVFRWLKDGTAPETPVAYTGVAGEKLIRASTQRLPVSRKIRSHIEIIRFAAFNRLSVELDYKGSTRRIEPYSLRQTIKGNIILYAHNIDKGEIRGYRIDRIQGARVTSKTFVPRFAIELPPEGPDSVPITKRTGS